MMNGSPTITGQGASGPNDVPRPNPSDLSKNLDGLGVSSAEGNDSCRKESPNCRRLCLKRAALVRQRKRERAALEVVPGEDPLKTLEERNDQIEVEIFEDPSEGSSRPGIGLSSRSELPISQSQFSHSAYARIPSSGLPQRSVLSTSSGAGTNDPSVSRELVDGSGPESVEIRSPSPGTHPSVKTNQEPLLQAQLPKTPAISPSSSAAPHRDAARAQKEDIEAQVLERVQEQSDELESRYRSFLKQQSPRPFREDMVGPSGKSQQADKPKNRRLHCVAFLVVFLVLSLGGCGAGIGYALRLLGNKGDSGQSPATDDLLPTDDVVVAPSPVASPTPALPQPSTKSYKLWTT